MRTFLLTFTGSIFDVCVSFYKPTPANLVGIENLDVWRDTGA